MVNQKTKRTIFILSGSLLLATQFISCGSETSVTGASSSSSDYAGPGSQWSLTKSGSTYTINMTDGSDTLEVETSTSTLSTGHIKLTVTDATAGGGATAPNNGDIAHGVEVPGAAFLLKPMEVNSETIAMVKAAESTNEQNGTCDISCTLAQDIGTSDKNMIYCIGQHPSDEDDRMTLLFVEK